MGKICFKCGVSKSRAEFYPHKMKIGPCTSPPPIGERSKI